MEDMLVWPDVIIGGAPRSGTTFLCEVLDKHPGVCLAKPIAPEPKVLLTGHPDGDAAILKRYEKYFAGAAPNLVRVEKTTNYFENADALSRFARLLPDTKLVILLRNPVDRAYSNWLWSRKNGLETLPFEKALGLEGERPSPLPPGRAAARPFDYATRGKYGTFAKAWIDALGRDRIGFFIFEEAIGRPERFIASLQKFMGLDPLPWSALRTGRVNATDPDKPIDPQTATRLREHFREEINRFHEITDVDVSAWGV
jgi:Sulfotransferase domain